ncbi:hypothetical protein QTP88_020231 [Uroleucon formosanum]
MSKEPDKFVQIYFMGGEDSGSALANRVSARCDYNNLDSFFARRIVDELDALLNEHNELLKIYKSHMDKLQSDNHAIVINPDKTPAGGHIRRFDAPIIYHILTHLHFEDRPLKYKLHGKRALAKHHLLCGEHKPIVPLMPKEGDTLKLVAWCKTERLPFVVYADFEALLLKTDRKQGTNTTTIHDHHPMSYGYRVVAAEGVPIELFDQFGIPRVPVIFRGSETDDDVAKRFVRDILGVAEKIARLYKEVCRHVSVHGVELGTLLTSPPRTLIAPSEISLATRKGVYPYEYTDSWDKLEVPSLPDKFQFYSALTETHVCDEDYDHAVRVWNHFGCTSLGAYSDLYLQIDVLLSADIFENFRDICMTTYHLHLAQYFTLPGFNFDCMLKLTKVELELLDDFEKILFTESGTRGGLVQASKRHARANNPETPGYNADEPSTSLIYLDSDYKI